MRDIKILVFILLLYCTADSIYGQGWLLSKTINGSEVEPRYSAIDDQNNLYVLAFFGDTIYSPYSLVSYGAKDLFLLKIDASGTVLWNKHIGNTGQDIPSGITLDMNNNCYITGTYYKNCRFTPTDSLLHSGNGDVFIAKYNSDGTFLWAKRVGSSSTTQTSVDLRYDVYNDRLMMVGNFKDSLVIGSSLSDYDTLVGNSFYANFIAQFDLDGNHIWSKKFLGTSNVTRFRRVFSSENGYYFGGLYQGNLYLDVDTITSYVANTYDAFVYKTDFTGKGEWIRKIRGSLTENYKSLATDEYDNVYILGNYNSTTIYVDSTESITKTYLGNTGGYDTYIAKYNRSGILQWFLRKGSTAKDIYNDFVIRNNVIYATGYFGNQIIFNNDTLKTTSPNISDVFLAAFNEIGDPIAGVGIQGTDPDLVTPITNAGTIVNMDANSRAYVSGSYKTRQIKIGEQIYTSNNINKSDLFFAIYQHPFKAVITDERQVSCFGLSDGMLKTTPYFGAPPYTYSWSHNAALNQPVADNLPAGTYTVTITDANSQTAEITAQVTQSAQLAIGNSITPVSCLGYGDGAIDITVTGGTIQDDYVYNWTSLDGSGINPLAEDQTGLTRGTYTVVVKDDNNCSASADLLVIQPEPFNYAGSEVIPINGTSWSVDLVVNGGNSPYDYSWTGPGTFTAATEDLSGLTTGGLYSMSLTDDKNCVSDTSFVVDDGTTLIAQITAKTDVLCHGDANGSATVTVTNGVPPFTYEWSDNPGNMSIQNIRTGMTANDYTVTVRDNDSHLALATVKILSPLSAITPVLDPQDLNCNGDNSGVVDLSVSGGTTPYDFAWNSGYTGEDLVNVAAGTYSVVITDAHDCVLQPPAVQITQPVAIGLDITLTGSILCHGDNTIDATANTTGGTGSFTYLWDDPGAQVTKTAFELFAGNYTVRVTDENGCFKTASTLILQPDSIAVEADITDPCPGASNGSIIPTVTGGTPSYDYVWSNDVFTRLNTDLAAGTYTLTITDNNNCSVQQEYTVSNFDTVKIASVTVTDLTCSGQPDGSITINATGGTGIYEYSIDGGLTYVTTATTGSLAEGEYTVLVQDDKNCLSENQIITLQKSGDCALIIYDAFSPNADGKNDVWNIGNIDNLPSCSVKIFNLWGIMVFSSDGYGTPWDGIYNSNELPSGTYYYVIDPGDGSKILSGAVSIVK